MLTSVDFQLESKSKPLCTHMFLKAFCDYGKLVVDSGKPIALDYCFLTKRRCQRQNLPMNVECPCFKQDSYETLEEIHSLGRCMHVHGQPEIMEELKFCIPCEFRYEVESELLCEKHGNPCEDCNAVLN